MTHMRVPSAAVRRYGFHVHKNGELVREQIVVAGSPAIAEVKVWRYLAADEYVWYSGPRWRRRCRGSGRSST